MDPAPLVRGEAWHAWDGSHTCKQDSVQSCPTSARESVLISLCLILILFSPLLFLVL